MFDNDDEYEAFKNLFIYIKRLHAIANENNHEMEDAILEFQNPSRGFAQNSGVKEGIRSHNKILVGEASANQKLSVSFLFFNRNLNF